LFFLPHIQKAFPKASGIKVALLGVAFKPNTDDIRESPALDMTLALSKLGYSIQAYDPKALNHYESWVKGQKISGVKICPSLEDCVSGADIIVLVTEWQEFQRLQPSRLRAIFKGTHLFDGKNILKGEPFEAVGISYRGVGRK
jgi:UDPglucose 6-dehydrogenase